MVVSSKRGGEGNLTDEMSVGMLFFSFRFVVRNSLNAYIITFAA